MKIRLADVNDAVELNRLNAAFNEADEPPERMAARLADPRRVETAVVAEIDGKLIGFAGLRVVHSLFYPEPQAELTELYVESAYRHQGVGRVLALRAEELARAAGAVELVVVTDQDNREAQALYDRLGYIPDQHLAFIKSL